MASVSELVEDVAEVMREPQETVNSHARVLIEAGMLPKSRGRAVAQVSTEGIIRLFMAVALAPKIRDIVPSVSTYRDLVAGGVPSSAPDSIQEKLEDFLSEMWTVLHNETETDLYKIYREAEIEFILNWPEVIVRLNSTDALEGGEMHFWPQGGYRQHWQGYAKRSVIIHGRAFLFCGDGKGHDYTET